jgi:hypothetical protein
MFTVLKKLFKNSNATRSNTQGRSPRRCVIGLEQLEGRELMSANPIATVTNYRGNAEIFAVTTDGSIWEQTEAANATGYSTGRWYVMGSGAKV